MAKKLKRGEGCLEGFRCPECGHTDRFNIDVLSTATVDPDGVDEYRDAEWDDKSGCVCPECGQAGTVADFVPKPKTPKHKPFRVRIRWGQSEEARKDNYSDYDFNTEAELDAFLYGVDEAQGWLDYNIVRIVPKEKAALHRGFVAARPKEKTREAR